MTRGMGEKKKRGSDLSDGSYVTMCFLCAYVFKIVGCWMLEVGRSGQN